MKFIDDVFNGIWHIGNITGDWSAKHLDRRKIKAPEVELGDDNLYFNVDVYSPLRGPTGDPRIRDPVTLIEAYTNIVSANVRVDIPYGGSVIIPFSTDIFSPGVDFINIFRFVGGIEGLPIDGDIYFHSS
jgi:hypothetical protein